MRISDWSSDVCSSDLVLLHPHIISIAQSLDGRGISRRAANAELLKPLDQARFGKARRRLGEMLVRIDLALERAIAPVHHRQQRPGVIGVLIVVSPAD